jgi:WD40 repeat protein
MRQAQGFRLSTRSPLWSKHALDLLAEAAGIAKDDILRNEAATSLIGLDAVPAKEFTASGASSLAFNASGAKLLLGAQPKAPVNGGKFVSAQPIRLWDKATDQVRKTKIFRPGPVAFDGRDQPLALTTKDQDPSSLVLWDLEKEQPLRELALPPKTKGKLQQLALSANGARVAALVALESGKSLIVAWDATTGKVLRSEETNGGNALALSPDGTMLATGDNDGKIAVWSTDKAAPPAQLKCNRWAVTALAFGTNPKKAPAESAWVLAAGDKSGTIFIWDLADQCLRTKCLGSLHDIYALAFSPDGTRLASGGRGWPRLWWSSPTTAVAWPPCRIFGKSACGT